MHLDILSLYISKRLPRFNEKLFLLRGQGRGVGSTRKKLDAAALEDRDKPYACDSESYSSHLALQSCLS